MSEIEGPFNLTKFCGATVTRFQSSAGWQEQVSQLRVDLVETDGDRFIKPEVGTPLSFTFQNFRFDGLVQQWGENRSSSGNPIYNVSLYSPVEILDAIQLILDAYRGVNLVCPNLLNVFGYLEAGGSGFGAAGKNESGIAWYKVRAAIEAIQGGTTVYSPGIKFKGHTYIIDFGGIPSVPDFYRVSGDFVSLIQVVRTVFEDSGYDFLVELRIAQGTGPHIISFKTHSRLIQVPFGQISAFVEGKENIISFEEGEELRNDITCGVIIGGQEEPCVPMYDLGDGNTIWQFWGYQPSAYLVPFGYEGNQPIVESIGWGNAHTAWLDASSIVDIIGNATGGTPLYNCSVLEMRFALANFDSWSVFIARKRPEIAEMLGLETFPTILSSESIQENPQSMYADTENAILLFTGSFEQSVAMSKITRLYDFVKNQAETYLGKQFIVRMPFFLKSYFEEETNKLLFNMEVSGDGYFADYIGFNSGPLGLNYENFNHFMNDNGKFIPYMKFSGLGIDLNSRNLSDCLIQGLEYFVRCNVDSRIIFTPAPAVLCSIDEPFWQLPTDPLGGIEEIAAVLDVDPDYLYNIISMYNGEFPITIHPMPVSPVGAAICLKNNESTYGVWTKIGVPGKIKIEQNIGLVPWNYGGFETMRVAAEAQLADIGAVSQTDGSGQVTFAGAPDISLGDLLNGVGPVVTSIDSEVGDNGVTTSYRMRSQTPVYGAFSRQFADRLRRLGTAAQDMRRTLRGLFERFIQQSRISTQANWTFRQNLSRAITHRESTSVFQGILIENVETGEVSPQIAAHSFAGALGGSNAHDIEKFKKTASMGLEGLLRPFSTAASDFMPHFEDAVHGITNSDLNPFKSGTDILWSALGDAFRGFYTQREGNQQIVRVREAVETTQSESSTRPMGLRGPLTVVGWGYDITGKPIPNSNTDDDPNIQDMTDDFLEGHLKKSNKWKAGPVDLRWDKWRKVWSMPGILLGVYLGDNKVKLLGVDDIIEVEHFLGSSLDPDKRVSVGYYAIEDKWYIISAQC